MTDKDWVAEELEREAADRPLTVEGPMFHATKNLQGITARKSLVALAVQREQGRVAAGFGHQSLVTGENHVSLTTSEARGRAYFDVLVAIAAIAEQRAKTADWLRWYVARWAVPDTATFLNEIGHEPHSELAEVFACALEGLGVKTAWQEASDIWSNAVTAVDSLDVEGRLAWLFALDAAAMQLGDDVDRGLGIVGADAKDWAQLRLSDVALLKIQLPAGAQGYHHEDEEEVRVRGELTEFEVIGSGEKRYETWEW